ncbi:ABC-F family ATP-binding cassette domain-containing protein [Butyrivibrio sp. YAB3001]|uniref:ABC-F family ATP-binding cassette domain-containing protein n=1 Tax=Butyrivibrio sp. YAB3001 TaxID=1520812 RepID=UPI0008F68A10|nr:ABC-F family ATP-binding cassette domain-containing protein [Butyrivibrio sp. YAB3001]SFB99393.1 ATP-binding cassette, subfamily F, uup [Butyrivibrio sp. YAB3001]
MNILNVENVSKSYMSKPVLEGVSVGVNDTDKIGIVGTNGTGKSTLLSIVAGVVEPDSGKVVISNGLRISYLPQNPVFDMSKTLLQNITEKIYAGDDHWDKMGEIKANLAKFGIDDPECNPSVLSGGQKKRAALVAAIMTPSDLLILDEPTNHLDSEMIEYLEDFLNHFRGALLMITHDRYFLDEVTNQILEIDKGKVYQYESNYSGFLELKQQRLDYEQAAERKAATLYRKDLAWMLRGARARSTKQKAHIQRFEALRDRQRPEEERQVELSSLPTRMGNKTIIIDGISKSYEGKKLFKDFSYTFNKLDRIGIIGPNGCGKSTLLKCIIGAIMPDTGTVEIGQTIKIGYFGQENEALDEGKRVIDYIKDTAEFIQTKDGLVSASVMCDRFLFDPNMQYAPISKLSGGEKRRLYLLKVLMEQPNVIILDEPTNDLDIQTLRTLEDYLDGFAGIIITVSHDRYFLDRVVTRIFSFEADGCLHQSEGGYSDYVFHKKESETVESQKNDNKGANSYGDGADKASKGKYRVPREKTKLSFSEQREYDNIEAEIEKLEEKSAKLDEEIAAAATDFPKLMKLSKEKEEVDAEIERKMDRYVELQELVDSFAK